MKPHIRLKGGVWSCATHWFVQFPFLIAWRIGYGDSPAKAFRDWETQ